MRWTYLFACFCSALILAGCGTIETGDIEPQSQLILDEDFFFCRIQPEIISAHSCASGIAGDGGGCHTSRSALRLDPAAETATPPECDGNFLVGTPPPSYVGNLTDIRFTIQADPLSSPFYRRPVGLDSHERTIFPEGSPEADLIIEWIGAI